jgi:hypothetical protein
MGDWRSCCQCAGNSSKRMAIAFYSALADWCRGILKENDDSG